MRIRSNGRRRQSATALVAAIALVTLICVVASVSIHSTMIKLAETRVKEANLDARTVLDSAASRLIAYLDGQLEDMHQVTLADIDIWRGQQPIARSGHYTVNFASGINTSRAADIKLKDIINQNPVTPPVADPLFPQLRMNNAQINLEITATSDKANAGFPNYRRAYSFQIRAVPTTEWTVYHPGSLRQRLMLKRDPSHNDKAALAFVGSYTGGNVIPDHSQDQALIAKNAPRNHRWYRPNETRAKKINNWSESVRALIGQRQVSDDTLTRMQNQLMHYRSLVDNKSGAQNYGMVDEDESIALTDYSVEADNIQTEASKNPYHYVALPTDPTPLQSSTVAFLDLAAYLANFPPPVDFLNVLIPRPENTDTIIVTNSANMPVSGNVEINITFPPQCHVFFWDSVNTNKAKLKVEGNIGFIAPALDILNTTNLLVVNRTEHPAGSYTITQVVNTDRNVVTVSRSEPDQFNALAAKPLSEQLVEWAVQQQINLLDSSGPFGLSVAADYGYFLDSLDTYTLNQTVKPAVGFYTDVYTNITYNIYTNQNSAYNFFGTFMCSDDKICRLGSTNQSGLVLMEMPVDDQLPNNIQIYFGNGSWANTMTQEATNTVTINHDFTQADIQAMQASISDTIADSYSMQAILTYWSPQNTPPSFPSPLTKLYSYPFAKAWMTIENNYFETYEEQISLYRTDDTESITTEGHLSKVGTTEMHPAAGETWKDYLWNSWQSELARIPGGKTVSIGLTQDTDRIDSDDHFTALNEGSWKAVTNVISQDKIVFNANQQRTHADIPKTSELRKRFYDRDVTFHYQTVGWTLNTTNIVRTGAPEFYGRLVVQDGIKTLYGYRFNNLAINGQLTYTKPVAEPRFALQSDFTVQRMEDVIPNNPDRYFDVRIIRNEIQRVN